MNTSLLTTFSLTLGLSLATPLFAQSPSYAPFGKGCGGRGGVPVLDARARSLPFLGETFVAEVTNLQGRAVGLGITGLSDTAWGPTPLPFDLTVIGMPGCLLYTDVRRTSPLMVNLGVGTWDTVMPKDPGFIGVNFYQQAFILDSSVPGLGAIMSNPAKGVIGAVPDLVITGGMPTVTPPTIHAGARVSLSSASVRNMGTGAAGASTTGYYLSTDSTITSADTLLSSVAHAGIDAGNSLPIASRSLVIPVDTPPGSYWIGMLADSQNAVPESNEGNNSVRSPLTVTASLADLFIFSTPPTATPTTVVAGDQVTMGAFSAKNKGTVPTGDFSVGYYLSANSTISDSDELLLQFPVSSLGVEASRLLSGHVVTIPQGTAPGEYWIGPLLDHTDQVPELDESNNGGARKITVTTLPDIVILTTPLITPNPIIQPLPLAPAPFSLGSFRIRNNGSVPTGPFRISFYFSTDEFISRRDHSMGFVLVGNMLPGQILTIRSRALFTPPGLLPFSRRWVGVFVDDQNAVVESNEKNNTVSQQVTVL